MMPMIDPPEYVKITVIVTDAENNARTWTFPKVRDSGIEIKMIYRHVFIELSEQQEILPMPTSVLVGAHFEVTGTALPDDGHEIYTDRRDQ